MYFIFPTGTLQLPGHCSWRLPLVAVLSCLNAYSGPTEWGHFGGPPLPRGSIQIELDHYLCVLSI